MLARMFYVLSAFLLTTLLASPLNNVLAGEVASEHQFSANKKLTPVGVSTLPVPANGAAPGFIVTLWYPSQPGTTTRFGQSRIRPGYLAVADGEPALSSLAPLIVLTHGTGGSAQSLAWIATELASHGAIVVAADHPASSGGDPERASMMQVWTQPQDVHHLLDIVLRSHWGKHIDANRIASVGFSLGGASSLMLAGARLQFARFPAFCEQHDDGACRAFAPYFDNVDANFYARTDADYRESRLRAAVAIAPGFTEAFTAESLRTMPTPVLLITGDRDQQLPPATHLPPTLANLPAHSQHKNISDAQHFSFLPLCGEKAEDILAESGEQFVCREFGAKSRSDIYAETIQAIIEFFIRKGVFINES